MQKITKKGKFGVNFAHSNYSQIAIHFRYFPPIFFYLLRSFIFAYSTILFIFTFLLTLRVFILYWKFCSQPSLILYRLRITSLQCFTALPIILNNNGLSKHLCPCKLSPLASDVYDDIFLNTSYKPCCFFTETSSFQVLSIYLLCLFIQTPFSLVNKRCIFPEVY